MSIPVTRLNSAEGGGKITSFNYQNIGFTAKIEAKVLDNGQIRLAGQIEDSSLGATGKDGRPIIQTLQQRILATLQDGVPLRINRVEEQGTRSLYIQVQAEVLEPSGKRVARQSD